MEKEKLQAIEESIRNASPLELASKLQEAELYDHKETREVVDEVYEEFHKQGNLVDEVAVPVFLSICDGFLECSEATRKLRKKGLTSSRIVNDCMNFSYEDPGGIVGLPDAFGEYKNAREQVSEQMQTFGKNTRPVYSSRTAHEASAKTLKAFKTKRIDENGGKKNLKNDYTGRKEATPDRTRRDMRRDDPKNEYRAEVDHIVPLKTIHEKYKGDYTLSDADIIEISNVEANYALTTMKINRGKNVGKFDMSVDEFIQLQEKNKAEGKPYIDLSDEQKENMRMLEKKSKEEIAQKAEQKRLDNLLGKGSKEQQKVILKETAKGAAKQSADYMVGNVILFIIKPLFYEIKDIFTNGLKEGVGAETVGEAFKIRFGRVKDYVLATALKFIGDNAWEFVKGFVSSLVEGLISLFVGIFKQILKLVKEGIKILTQAGKVLFGKESSQMTAAQKGDAIIKIIGGSVIAICGIGIEALLNKIGVPDPWSTILSTMLSGIASTLFMLLLDKIDLFSVKAEKRRQRIEEIFDARIKDIKEAGETLNSTALEVMITQQVQFTEIQKSVWDGIEGNNIKAINVGLFKLADFLHVDLGYKDQDEFVEKFNDMELAL